MTMKERTDGLSLKSYNYDFKTMLSIILLKIKMYCQNVNEQASQNSNNSKKQDLVKDKKKSNKGKDKGNFWKYNYTKKILVFVSKSS